MITDSKSSLAAQDAYDKRLGQGMARRIEVLYADALRDLKRRLQDLERYPRADFHDETDVLKMSTALFAFGVYGNGCAILNLYRSDVGRQIPAIVRSQFEAILKLAYCEHHPKKARDFIDSEPFVRWMTARGKTLRPALRDAVERDCLAVVRTRPELLKGVKLKDEIIAGKIQMDYDTHRAIAKKLDFPPVGSLQAQLAKDDPGWTSDLYATVYRIGSLPTHHSIGFLRDAFVDVNEDGSVRFSIDQHYDGAPDFVLQSSNYLIGMASKVTQRFGGNLDDPHDPLREIYERQQAIVKELKAGDLI
jgi:hypothetical protein